MPHRLIPASFSHILESLFGGALEGNHAARSMCVQVKELRIGSTPTGAEQDTGWDLPSNCIVRDVWLYVDKEEVGGTTKTLDVGLLSTEAGGDTDGFLSGVNVATAGMKTGRLVSTGQTRGALLHEDESGSGGLVPRWHVGNGTAKSVVYKAGSNNWTTFRGSIFIEYVALHQ